ncbi:EAL domain-containing protein [Chroococcus sp. FPU101]|uniref:EAL domain-containing protein n=1 Tax=Chroococcus sp. FPU101 TaxID=1974212 RepID=UPI001A8E4F5C|nr:EAL domain-containing protein [Chroococcus sp. FPU101]GFE71791.1 diguanylate cyclase/phosphodiesterase [Chroococcus sp. FPU101]
MNHLSSFRHILVIEDQKARRIVALEEATYSIGRESSNSIVIYESVVSRRHATFLRIRKSPHGNEYFYRIVDGDLEGNKSTNGLIINGLTCESHDLRHGDVVLFGGRAKTSYYIIPSTVEIALFNPIDSSLLEEVIEQSNIAHNNSYSTLVSDKNDQDNLEKQDLVRLASFPELSPNPIIEINYHGEITYTNPAANIKFESLREEVLKHPILKSLIDQSKNTEGNLLLREVQIGDNVFEQYVHYLSDSQLIRSYIFDITERKQSEQKLKYQAFHDLLTSLPNRAWFNKQLSISLEQAKRNKGVIAVIFLDLDGFKNINDSLGHSYGDQVLQQFAKRLVNCVRAGDTVARWGGDEFTILLPQVRDEDDTIKLAQRIIEVLKKPFHIKEHQLYIKTSLGIAIYPRDGDNEESLLKNADAALYRAKEKGRNRYQFYSSTITSKALLLLKLENSLYQAIEKNEFSLHYQPQVKLTTGEITGVEALLRWYHPDMGQVAPAKLIALAEQTDLIVPISQWVLKTACSQNLAWQQAGFKPLPITVNFSPRQFQQPNLVTMIEQTLAETGLPPYYLEVEITETSIIHDEKFAAQVFKDLRSLGVSISLDDFGTGYSSLSHLQKFPFQTLKIDQSFVQALQVNPEDTAILSAMIMLGRSFNLRVVAEGVETLQQLEILEKLHCEEVQGYWFSRPLKTEDATQLLLQHCIKRDITENSSEFTYK